EIAGADASAEVPFVLSLKGTLIRGSIDLLIGREDGSALVVDYKTDRLDGRDPVELADRYEVQRDLYAMAAGGRGEPVETAYVFLEQPETPVQQEFGPAELEHAQERIEGLLGRLAESDFAVTDNPHAGLCHDCPARERLCSYGPEMTLAGP